MKNKSAQESNSGDYSGSVRERILAAAGALSRQQRVIADFLLDHLQKVPLLSVMEIAERTQTSEATVVRLGQRLGYKGYARLKMALVDMLREEREGGTRAQAALPADVGKDVLAAMSRLEIQNIERTLDSIDRRAFERSATLMAEADHVFCFGLGISAHLAELAAYLFTEHGVRATALDSRFTSPREQLVVMRPGDIILGLSFQPYSQATLEVLEEAQSRGLATVAITDRATAGRGPRQRGAPGLLPGHDIYQHHGLGGRAPQCAGGACRGQARRPEHGSSGADQRHPQRDD